MSRPAAISRANSISRCWSIARAAALRWSLPPKAAWRSRTSPRGILRRSCTLRRRSGRRHVGLPRAPPGLWTWPHRQPDRRVRPLRAGALPHLHRTRLLDRRDQPACRHRQRRSRRAGCQDQLRRQRAVPPSGTGEAARRGRGRSEGTRGRQVQPQLRGARRQHRLPGERRRSRHGDDGHHQAVWRGAGEFPRCGRRRHQGTRHRRIQDHPVGSRTSKASWSTSSAASCAAT